jgi:hypothetical protein
MNAQAQTVRSCEFQPENPTAEIAGTTGTPPEPFPANPILCQSVRTVGASHAELLAHSLRQRARVEGFLEDHGVRQFRRPGRSGRQL